MAAQKVAITRVHTGERLLDESQRQAQRASGALNQQPFSSGNWIRGISLTPVSKTVDHGLGRTPRGFFATVAQATKNDDAVAPKLWVSRVMDGPGLANLLAPAGNFSTGCRFTMLSSREIIGVRFAGYNPGAARTYRCKLYNDTTATLIASKDLAVAAATTSLVTGFFPTPYQARSGDVLVASIYDTSGAVYIKTTVDTLAGVLPVSYGTDTKLTALNLFVAGDARPTGAAGAENYWVEPVFGTARSVLVELATTQPIDTTRQVNLVAAAPTVADLWFY